MALHIFVAGTVNGCTDLQNAKLYEAPRFVDFRSEGWGKSHGRSSIGIDTPSLSQYGCNLFYW